MEKIYTLLEWVPYEGYLERLTNTDIGEIKAYLKKSRASHPNTFYSGDYWIVQDGPDPDTLLDDDPITSV